METFPKQIFVAGRAYRHFYIQDSIIFCVFFFPFFIYLIYPKLEQNFWRISFPFIPGPVTVPMVSQSGSPPMPMPVQVPPGHVMQQIVDESGTLRHVILSTQHQQIHSQGGVQPHIHSHYVSIYLSLTTATNVQLPQWRLFVPRKPRLWGTKKNYYQKEKKNAAGENNKW